MIYKSKLDELESERDEFNRLEKLFDMSRSRYKLLNACVSDLKNLKTMWDSIAMVNY